MTVNRELWLLYVGGILATRKDEDPKALMGRIESENAERDLCRVIDAIALLDGDKRHEASATIREWLRDRGCEVSNGHTPMEAIAESIRVEAGAKRVRDVVAKVAASKMLKPSELADFLESQVKELRDE